MAADGKQLSKTSIDTLSAISRYRYQRRSGRVWLVGNKRFAASTIADLERRSFVREVAFNGTPQLVLTAEGKRFITAA